MSLAGTKLAMTTAYHPQADGQLERTNRTIEATLRIMILESTEQWTQLLPAVEFAHNSSINLSTGKSPFALLYGGPPENFGDKATRKNFRHSLTAEEMAADLAKRRTEAEEALKRAQTAQKRYYDGKHAPIKFLPGDLACLRLQRRKKLDPVSQVVQVVEVVSPVAYRIKVPQGSKMHDVVSIEYLRKYKVREGTANPTPIMDTTNEPKIRKILGERMWKDRQEVLCLREEEEIAEAAWESIETLGDDLSLLKEFRERSEGVMKESEGTKMNENSGRTMIDGIAVANEEDLEEKSGPRRSGRTRRLPQRLKD